MNTKLFISVALFLSTQLIFGQQSDTITINNTRVEPEWVTAFPSGFNSGIIKTDNQGNVVVLDGSQHTDLSNSRKLLWYANVLSKYNKSGEMLWSINVQKNPPKHNFSIDSQGNIFVLAGFGNGILTLHHSADSSVTYTSQRNPLCVVKYDKNGNLLKAYFYSYSENASLSNISIDKNDNLYIAGYYHKHDEIEAKHRAKSSYYLMKINNNMEKEWERMGEITGKFFIETTAIDNENNIYAAGNMQDTVKVGEKYFIEKNSSHRKLLVIKFDTKGNLLWATDTVNKGNHNSIIHKIVTDIKGNLYIAANRHDSYESFISKVSPDGKREWQVKAKFPKYSQSYSYFFEDIAVDENDNVYFAGQGYTTTFSSLDNKIYILEASIFIDSDNSKILKESFFIGSYNSEGELQYLNVAGGEGGDSRCRSIAIHENNLFVLARYQNKVQFESTTLYDRGGSRDSKLNAWFAKYDLRKIYEKHE